MKRLLLAILASSYGEVDMKTDLEDASDKEFVVFLLHFILNLSAVILLACSPIVVLMFLKYAWRHL